MPFAPVSEEGSDDGNAGTSAFCPSSGDTMGVPSSVSPRDILQFWCRRVRSLRGTASSIEPWGL
jgi:hypothetical protein